MLRLEILDKVFSNMGKGERELLSWKQKIIEKSPVDEFIFPILPDRNGGLFCSWKH